MIPLHHNQAENKKDYYRRLAQIRKARFLNHSKNYDDSLKFHFTKRTQDEVQSQKTKKICKHEPKAQQKIRNRMAAQQSRERHRTYVEQLQRKVKMYEQIIQKQGLLCKQCKKDLVSQTTESQELSHSLPQPTELEMKEEGIDSYLKDQIIRIDNEGVTTPYGMFFIVGIIAVIAVFTFTSAAPSNESQRLLAYYSAQPAQRQVNREANIQDLPNFIDFIKSNNKVSQQCTRAQSNPVKKNLQSYTPSKQGWTQVGKYICSKPQVLSNGCSSKKPEFWLVHTLRNGTEQLKATQNENYKIESKEWEKVQISQCFLGTV